jgi:hypothetical protein
MNTTNQASSGDAARNDETSSKQSEKGESLGKRGRQVLTDSEENFKKFGEEAREEIKRPTFGAALAGAAAVGAASLWGVAEAAVGALTAYIVFRILKKRRSHPKEA